MDSEIRALYKCALSHRRTAYVLLVTGREDAAEEFNKLARETEAEIERRENDYSVAGVLAAAIAATAIVVLLMKWGGSGP